MTVDPIVDLLVWRLFGHNADRFARMRAVVKAAQADPAIKPPRVIESQPRWGKFVLTHDATGRSLLRRALARFRRAA